MVGKVVDLVGLDVMVTGYWAKKMSSTGEMYEVIYVQALEPNATLEPQN